MNNQTVFCKLKPLCVSILKDCTTENIGKLKEVVEDLDRVHVQSLLEYIILPVRARLNTPLQEKVTISCINFLSLIFAKCNIQDWQLFSDIFKFMISKLCDPLDFNKILSGNEELKLAVCQNISCLVQSSSEEVLNEMYSLSFRPNLAHAFYMLNMMLNNEKSKQLQVVVISTIGTLTYSESVIKSRYEMTKDIAGEALASCLPGISIALQKVICGDVKQGHNVLIKSLNILSDLIVLVIGDDRLEKCYAENTSSEIYSFAYKSGKLSRISESLDEKIPVILKDKSWFASVSENLKVLIQNVTGIVCHTHWKVRLEFLKFSCSLLFKCTKTLKTCIPILLQAVFGLSVDENELISSNCKDFLTTFTEHFQNVDSSLHSVIIENIENLTSELMKYKLSANDSKKLNYVRCLHGYIKISSSTFNSVLFSMNLLEKIILSVITLIEFDTSVLNVIEEMPLLDTCNVAELLWPKKKFKYFEDENIINIICEICFSLRRIQNSQLYIDYLIDQLSYNVCSLQCIFLIGTIIKGFSFQLDSDKKYSSIVSDVLEVFLESTLLDPPINNSEASDTQVIGESSDLAIPNTAFNKNKLQICLILEAIARCAECLKTSFKIHLIKVLCPVMEKAGSSNFIISQYGCLCLFVIAQSCEYDSVNELIKDNADYITNILLINFNSYFYKPEVAVVLHVVMKQCDSEALLLFRDLIFQILNNIDYNQKKAYFLMHVLSSVIVSIKRWFPSKKGISVSKKGVKSLAKRNLKSSILEYKIIRKTVDDMNDIEESNINSISYDADDYSNTELKSEIPLHVNITCEIFKRCVHLQSSENSYLRMLVLDTAEVCITTLRDYENQLHPLVHEFWDPFLKRFLEESFISKAFIVLLTIVTECGDFVRHRSFKDVMPKLVLFLKKEHSKSHMKCNFKNYQWSRDHFLQTLILSEIGHLCFRLDIDVKDICDVANVCLPYLEKYQPKVLQDAAMKSLKELAFLNSDAVWFLWNVLYSEEKIIVPPHDSLKPVLFAYCDASLTKIKCNEFL